MLEASACVINALHPSSIRFLRISGVTAKPRTASPFASAADWILASAATNSGSLPSMLPAGKPSEKRRSLAPTMIASTVIIQD